MRKDKIWTVHLVCPRKPSRWSPTDTGLWCGTTSVRSITSHEDVARAIGRMCVKLATAMRYQGRLLHDVKCCLSRSALSCPSRPCRDRFGLLCKLSKSSSKPTAQSAEGSESKRRSMRSCRRASQPYLRYLQCERPLEMHLDVAENEKHVSLQHQPGFCVSP